MEDNQIPKADVNEWEELFQRMEWSAFGEFIGFRRETKGNRDHLHNVAKIAWAATMDWFRLLYKAIFDKYDGEWEESISNSVKSTFGTQPS